MDTEKQYKLMSGFFGIERETLRVQKGTDVLASTDHPFPDDPCISKDFCESQTEIITPACRSTGQALESLKMLDQKVRDRLDEMDETLWMNSNPPYVPNESMIRIAHFEGQDREKEIYRKYLREKYGIRRQLLSGIHYNFSFSEESMDVLRSLTGTDGNALYMKLASHALKSAWLIAFLTAASPEWIYPQGKKKRMAASVRCSSEGYWNDFIPVLDYTSLSGYTDSIEKWVDEGCLFSIWELYLPVRLKAKGQNSLTALRRGISHIELRMLDLNPLTEEGIAKEDLTFLHSLMIFWALEDPFPFEKAQQSAAVRNIQRAALMDEAKIWIEGENGAYRPVRDAALDILSRMSLFYESWEDQEFFRSIEYQRRKVLSPEFRYAKRVLQLQEQERSRGIA